MANSFVVGNANTILATICLWNLDCSAALLHTTATAFGTWSPKAPFVPLTVHRASLCIARAFLRGVATAVGATTHLFHLDVAAALFKSAATGNTTFAPFREVVPFTIHTFVATVLDL